jgi:hypothetical protein
MTIKIKDISKTSRARLLKGKTQLTLVFFMVAVLVAASAITRLNPQTLLAEQVPTADGFGVQEDLPQPTGTTVDVNSGGDGFTPILYGDNVYTIFHHSGQAGGTGVGLGGVDIGCANRYTGVAPCVGWPGNSAALSTATGSTIAATGGDIITSYFSNGVLDEPSGKLYYAVSTQNTSGINCLDLVNLTNCGYVQMINRGAETSTEPDAYDSRMTMMPFGQMNGVRTMPSDRVYAYSFDDHSVYCLDTATQTTCGVTDLAPSLLPPTALPTFNTAVFNPFNGLNAYSTRHTPIEATRDDTRAYVVGNFYNSPTSNLHRVLLCFDRLSGNPCTGTPYTGVETLEPSYSVLGNGLTFFLTYDISMNQTAACVRIGSIGDPSPLDVSCVPTGTSTLDPNYLQTNNAALYTRMDQIHSQAIAEGGAFFAESSLQMFTLGTRMFMPYRFTYTSANDQPDGVLCYEWATNATCPGFGTNGFHEWTTQRPALEDSRDYGYSYDGSCMWGDGDAGFVWSFNSSDGSSPCFSVTSTLTLDASTILCNTSNGTYDRFGLSSMNFSNITQSALTLTDQNGDVLPAYDGVSISAVPLSLVSISTASPTGTLTARLSLRLTNTNDWTGSNQPLSQLFVEPSGLLRANGCTVPGVPNTGIGSKKLPTGIALGEKH